MLVFLAEIESATYSCNYGRGNYFLACKFENVQYTDRADGFEIVENEHLDVEIWEVLTKDSVFHFLPMEILGRFKNLVVLGDLICQ
jgi:hypothetical protein